MRLVVSLAILACSAVPALAQSKCFPPPAPPHIDGNTATIDQVHAAVKAAQTFVNLSDGYQACIGREIEDARAEAKLYNVPFDPAFAALEVSRVDENQKQKEDVGAAANSAVQSYRKKHPE